MTSANDIANDLARGLAPCLDLAGVRDVRVRGAIGVVELETIASLNDLKSRLAAQDARVRPFRNIVYLTPALTIDEIDLKTLTDAVVNAVLHEAGRVMSGKRVRKSQHGMPSLR